MVEFIDSHANKDFDRCYQLIGDNCSDFNPRTQQIPIYFGVGNGVGPVMNFKRVALIREDKYWHVILLVALRKTTGSVTCWDLSSRISSNSASHHFSEARRGDREDNMQC